MPTNSSGGRIQDSRVPSAPPSVAAAGELDIVLRELAGEVGRHLHGGEVAAPVRHRLGQRAADHVARHRDLLHLVGVEVLLELAVRDHVGARRSRRRRTGRAPRSPPAPRRSARSRSEKFGFGAATRSLLISGINVGWRRAGSNRTARNQFFTSGAYCFRSRNSAATPGGRTKRPVPGFPVPGDGPCQSSSLWVMPRTRRPSALSIRSPPAREPTPSR